MFIRGYSLVLALACVGPAHAQGELPFWMPIHYGDTSIYQHESRSSGKTERWKTEENVEKSIPVAEGYIVMRRVRTFDGKPPIANPGTAAWLIHGECLYDLDPADWDSRRPIHLSQQFAANPPWAGREHVRVICFPLSQGTTWGKESGHEWRVTGITTQDPASPDKGTTFQLSSRPSSNSSSAVSEDVWFERSVGVVKDEVHTAANTETDSQLLYFAPGPSLPVGSIPAPVGELGVEYSYNSLSTSTDGESNQSGASVYGQYFFKKSNGGFSLIADFSGSGSNSSKLYTYLLGTRLNSEWRRAHLIFYEELLIGGSHVRVNGTSIAGPGISITQNSLAFGAGDGVDLRINRHSVLTVFRLDWLSLQVPDASTGVGHWRGDMRVSGGIGLQFGQK